MSAVGPEFYNYIKNLEDNGDKPVSVSSRQESIDFEFNNSTCYQCNGYYGPSFGEPVCVTCHAFLFPDFPSYLPSSYFYSEKTDDGDSGNDEPSDLNYSAERKNRFCVMPAWFYYRNSLDSETSPEDEASRASNGPGASNAPGGSNGAGGSNAPGGSNGAGGSNGPGGNSNNGGNPGPAADGNNGGSADGGQRDLIELGVPPPPPNVARSLIALSTPRPPDNLTAGLVERLPSEVLLSIFRYLDDMSLSACACVCARWCRLVRARVPPGRWAAFTALRWPLFRPMLENYDWHKKYQSLVESSFCRNCLVQMCVQAQPAGDENAWRWNRLWMELKMLRNDPPEGIAATPLDIKCCHWQATVLGPVGSPYEGGVFFLYIQVPYSYPMSPPVVRFLTRILHPNISRHGDVGIDSVHHNWSLALTLSKVLISIQSLLTDPYTAVCMEPELGAMYVQSRAKFEALARRWTWRYAMQEMFY